MERVLELENTSFADEAYSVEDFIFWYEEAPDLFVVAEQEEGFIIAYLIGDIFPDGGYVVSLAVDSQYRQQGVGKALVTYLVEKVQEAGLNLIELEARVSNATGIQFWKKLGFFPFGIMPDYYPDGEEAILMRKDLSSKTSVTP